MEISNALTFLGTAERLNTPFLNLMNILRNASGGVRGPSLRIGGNSAEFSVWWDTTPHTPLPANQTYAITPEDIKSYAAAFPVFDGRAVIDTSMFVQNDPSWAAAHAKGVAALWGWERVEGVEVGNEVEIFHDSGVRPHSWSFSDYEVEFEAHAAALEAAGMPRGLIQGAVFCCNNSDYNAGLPGYTRKYAARGLLTSISYHHYSIGGCGGKTADLWKLLSNDPFVLSAAYLQPFVTAALSAGVKFRVGEGNSVSCGGAPGVSDVFASALFALDVMMETAAIGVDQWNWHGGPGAHYTAISFARPPAPPGPPEVRPLFYGLWAFTEATAGNSSILRASVRSSDELIKLWATGPAGSGVYRVLAIHKNYNATLNATVSVTAPPGLSPQPGQLLRLLAPHVTSPFNVSWGGQTFDDSATGLPRGPRVAEAVPASGSGFSFSLPPATAALLTFTAL